MESIYFVMSWLCHRTCKHCYEERFRPYHGEELEAVVRQSRENIPRIVDNLPDRMTYRDLSAGVAEKRGRIIMAGGEILLNAVRESALYPALEQLRAKYASAGGVDLIVQTTGDVITATHVAELLERGVNIISISGMDAFHEGYESPEARDALRAKLTGIFTAAGMTESRPGEIGGASYHFFGATPDSWIGALWPRGRSWRNELSTATLADNFCNRWSGGLNFLDYKHGGSEVAIDPEGNVFPCCMKTKAPVGNLLNSKLEVVLESLIGNPVYEAISMGHPERMGIGRGWSVERFVEKSRVALPSGRVYENLCIGCDAFHAEVLMNSGGLVAIEGVKG